MQVYDLGVDGKDIKRVAEVANFAQAAERAAGGHDIFGGRSSADRKACTPHSSFPPHIIVHPMISPDTPGSHCLL